VAGWAATATGCADLPALKPVSPARAQALRARCRARFPQGTWRVVHTIEARMPLGYRTALVGVAAGDTRERHLRVVAMALEGVTLLDLQVRKGRVTVSRAVPPLDRNGVAEGMARDVELLLFRPPGPPPACGLLRSDEQPVCRYRTPGGAVVDVAPGRETSWALRRYDADGRLRRIVRARGAAPGRFARRMILRSPGAGGYRLSLRLLRVERKPTPQSTQSKRGPRAMTPAQRQASSRPRATAAPTPRRTPPAKRPPTKRR
jgi:hypothetical protein